MAESEGQYDFIIVGGGAAGCILAWRLANSASRPRVLLLEAGGRNNNEQARMDGERFRTPYLFPEQNWSYKSTPTATLNDRVIDYDRGRGLGGSTSINFGNWTVTGRDDHDRLAELCGDPEWSWDNAKERYKRIENYQNVLHMSDVHRSYLDAQAIDHGMDGPMKVGFPADLEPSFVYEMDRLLDQNVPLNKDVNNGNQLGVGICPNSATKGRRTTAADAVVDPPSNLAITTDSPVARVLFSDRAATGVESISGKRYHAAKEVIVSCGALDTPKILMHSGIGPASQLAQHGIPVLRANDNIGANLQDHAMAFTVLPRKAHNNTRSAYYADPTQQASAVAQWHKDGTGPLAEMACEQAIAFLKHAPIDSDPLTALLPPATRAHLARPTVPHFELLANSFSPLAVTSGAHAAPHAVVEVIFMNPQSRGRVRLASADPSVQLDIDLQLLGHPWDAMVGVRAMREAMRLADREGHAAVEGEEYVRPRGTGDEEIMEWLRENVIAGWHAAGTVAVGECLDADFRVKGLEGLRVADMSSVPLLPNAHPQTMACLVGLMAGDKLAVEYKLDEIGGSK